MSSGGCNSRPFSWLRRTSCFPDPHHHRLPSPTTTTRNTATSTTISSLPDDLLLDLLSRLPSSSLPSASLVSRRWSLLLDSPAFFHLRRLNNRLRHSLFALSSYNHTFSSATLRLSHLNDAWTEITTSSPLSDVVSLSHPRVAAIGRAIYVISRNSVLRYDTWTRKVTLKPEMLVSRKKFAAAVVSGKIYVAGGSCRSSEVEEYDPDMNVWRVVSHAPRFRYGCIGAAVDGIFYVIGGLMISNQASRAAAGSGIHMYASSMDLYDVEAQAWLRSRTIPCGGCVVAACAAGEHLYVLASHAVELSFWRFNASRTKNGFGEWCRLKSPPLPTQVKLDSTVRFSCVGVGDDKVAVVQVMGCIDDLLRRSGRSTKGLKDALVLVYNSAAEEWSRGPDLPAVIQRAACVCVEC